MDASLNTFWVGDDAALAVGVIYRAWKLQMDYEGPAPDVRRDRPTLGRCQYNEEIGLGVKVQTGRLVDDSLQILILARADWPDERQAAQTCIQMFKTCAKLSSIGAQDQTNF